MPVSQTGPNVQVALKRQSGIGVPASGSGAIGLEVVPQQGLKLTKAIIPNEAIRRDGQTARGRHGSRKADSAYQIQIGVGMCDDLLEAVMRGTWVASANLTSSDFTTITTTTSTIVFASGNPITKGIHRGDKIKLTGSATSGNNGKWLRVVGVSSTAITLPAGSLTLNATPDSGATIVIAKTVTNGTTPVERYYTVEEFGQDINEGLLGTDLKISKLELQIQPNKNIIATFTFMGLDVTEQDSSANFTSPVYSTALPLVMADGTIRVNGVDYSVLTGFTLTWDLGGSVPDVLSKTAPDVFLANGKISGSFTAIRQDMTFFAAFRAETQVDFFIDMVDTAGNFLSVYVGNATLSGADAPLVANGPLVATVPWAGGIDDGGSDRALTTLKWATSAP